jgi:4-hydroxy-L-threonine phosphate dehydrogenase PdxA
LSIRIGISIGDVTGIGPEVSLKALSNLDAGAEAAFLLIGDLEHLLETNRRLGLGLRLEPFAGSFLFLRG